MLGFIYPGKGHDAVLDAVAALPADVVVVALGQVSAGHDDLLARAAARRPRRTGRRLSVSGFLDDDDLARRACERVDVPVVPAVDDVGVVVAVLVDRRRSATARRGQRVHVRAGRRSRPASSTLYRPGSPDALRRAIVRALAEPASTWHGGVVPAPLRTDRRGGRRTWPLYRRLQAPR